MTTLPRDTRAWAPINSKLDVVLLKYAVGEARQALVSSFLCCVGTNKAAVYMRQSPVSAV